MTENEKNKLSYEVSSWTFCWIIVRTLEQKGLLNKNDLLQTISLFEVGPGDESPPLTELKEMISKM